VKGEKEKVRVAADWFGVNELGCVVLSEGGRVGGNTLS